MTFTGCLGGDEQDDDGRNNDAESLNGDSDQSTGDDNSDRSDGTGDSVGEQDDSSSGGGDGSSDGGDELEDGNIEEGATEFENYTRETFIVEIQDFCNDGTNYENWIGPEAGQLGFGMSLLGQEGCEQISRTDETYDTETNTLTLELDFSAPDGATECDSDCTVQHDVLVGYNFPMDAMSDLSVEVYVARNGNEPELRTSWPVRN